VALSLETDLDDFHGGDDGDGFGDTSSKTGFLREKILAFLCSAHTERCVLTANKKLTEESGLSADLAGLLVGEKLLVGLETGESDGHLRDDTGQDGAETLVQGEGGLLLHDADTGVDEAAPRLAGGTRPLGKLHSDLDGIWTAV